MKGKKTSPAGASPQVLTLRQVARLLNCHPSTLYRLAGRGDVPAFRVGRGWRFQRDALEEWIRRRTK